MKKDKTSQKYTAKHFFVKMMLCSSICLAISPVATAQLTNGSPSKVAVTAQENKVASAASVTTSVLEERPSTELLFHVERVGSSAEGDDADELISSATQQPALELNLSVTPTAPQTILHLDAEVAVTYVSTPNRNRRPTPSKIAVASANAVTETQTVLSPSVEVMIPVTVELAEEESIKISRRPTSSKVAVNAGKDGELLYERDSLSNTANAPVRIEALNAYLTTSSKTPVSALEDISNRSSLLSINLAAKSALIIDQDSREVLYSRNALEALPIASITKLMTAMVVLDAKQNMNQLITITKADVDTLKGTSSRLYVGAKLSRRDLLHLTLMSSENRAAHALSRNYPGGTKAFVAAMNSKAQALGMMQTSYIEPTGLSDKNRSSAQDLVWLVDAAYKYPLIRQWSTSTGHKVSVGGKQKLSYINSNRLVDSSQWSIGLQKTGYIREAGYCLVMQTTVSGKHLIMVFLDVDQKKNRIQDAENMRKWILS